MNCLLFGDNLKWRRGLIQQVMHAGPLLCPQCQNPMRVFAVTPRTGD